MDMLVLLLLAYLRTYVHIQMGRRYYYEKSTEK